MRIDSMRGGVRPSSTSVLLFLLVAPILLLPKEARPQERAPDLPTLVAVPEKTPFLAGALEVVTFPTIGYAYAGNWKRGLPSAGVRILGLVLWAEQLNPFDSPPCEARCVAGALLLFGGWVWAASDAAGTARRTNEERRAEALSGIVLPTIERGRVGAQIQLRIPR